MTIKNEEIHHRPTGPTDPHEHARPMGWWPSALGLGAGLFGGGGSGTSITIASVVAVIALIYVAAATTGRRGHAWWGFLLSFPVVLSGRLTGIPMLPFLIMGALTVVLIIVGWRRGAWSQAEHRRQLYALAGFGPISLAGALTDGTLAAVLIAGGLAAHAGWDVIYLVRNKIVGRRYAEFCAVLDAALAATIIWGLL